MTNGEFTRQEMASQVDVWRQVLATLPLMQDRVQALVGMAAGKSFLITGCGSTHYLARSVAFLLNQRAVDATARPASDFVFFPEVMPEEDAWLWAISRSGRTSETLWAVKRFRERSPGGKVLAVSCEADSQLAQLADFSFIAEGAAEKSVAQTRSFTSMFLLSQALICSLAGCPEILPRLQTLPGILDNLISVSAEILRDLGQNRSLERFFFLGGGPLRGLAAEAMLKTKEMTVSWAEAYHPLEFRHGPISVVNNQTLVVGFISDNAGEEEIQVLKDSALLGARTVAIVESAGAFDLSRIDNVLELKSGLSTWERAILYLPPIQWLAYHRARAKAVDPDRPQNLVAVVELQPPIQV